MRALQNRLVAYVTVLMVGAALMLSWLALGHFTKDLPPEMERTVAVVGHSAVKVLEKAHTSGVPFDRMVGVPQLFDAIRKDNPSVHYMLISSMAGDVLYQSGNVDEPLRRSLAGLLRAPRTSSATVSQAGYFNTGIPLVFRHVRVGTLYLGQPVDIVQKKLNEVTYDVVAVLVVACLIVLELLRFVLTFVIATPALQIREFLSRLKQGDFSSYLPFDRLGGIGQLSSHLNGVVEELNRQAAEVASLAEQAPAQLRERVRQALAAYKFSAPGRRQLLSSVSVDHIRWPFFLLIFADSLSLSFFPIYVEQFYRPEMGLSRNLVIGLPISVFMFVWALSMPWAGTWCDRMGHRKAFVLGSVVTTAGLILTACSQTIYDLLLWRSLTALGYGLVFITAQTFVTAAMPAKQRTRGMAIFLSSFFAGSLSGSAIGGILADRMGYGATILLSAGLSAVAAALVLRFLRQDGLEAGAIRKPLTLRDLKLLMGNKKFVAITFLSAVPAKVALTGFVYYSVPLYLKLIGSNQSTTGRVMMIYGLAIILVSSSVAKFADRVGQLQWFVCFGGYAATAAMAIVCYYDNLAGLLAGITMLGLAHAVGVSPQLALINEYCKDVVQEVGAGTATGIFRMIERLGNMVGPLIAGVLISQFGFKGAFTGIGLLCLSCISCFMLLFIPSLRHRGGRANANA